MLVNNAALFHYMPLADLPADKACAPISRSTAARSRWSSRRRRTAHVAGVVVWCSKANSPQY